MSTGSTLRATHPRLVTLVSCIAVVAIAGATAAGLVRTVFVAGTPGGASVSAQQRALLAHALDSNDLRGVKVGLKHWRAPRVPRPRRQLAPPPMNAAISITSATPTAGGSSLPQTADDGNSHDE